MDKLARAAKAIHRLIQEADGRFEEAKRQTILSAQIEVLHYRSGLQTALAVIEGLQGNAAPPAPGAGDGAGGD